MEALLLSHCIVSRYFFSDDPHRPGWKIVCRTEVRGRRGQLQLNERTPTLIDVGNDEDFVGLQPEMPESEPRRVPANGGGVFIPVATEGPTHGGGWSVQYEMDCS